MYKGRRPSLTTEQVAELRAQAATGVPKTQLAKQYGIHRDTVYRYLASDPTEAPATTPAALSTQLAGS